MVVEVKCTLLHLVLPGVRGLPHYCSNLSPNVNKASVELNDKPYLVFWGFQYTVSGFTELISASVTWNPTKEVVRDSTCLKHSNFTPS